jgi:prevent-host-death family protein
VREATIIRGLSGQDHSVQAVAVDDKTNRVAPMNGRATRHEPRMTPIAKLEIAAMVQISVSELQRRFGEAQQEPVEITRHGRREFVLMSAEHFDWLTVAAKRTHRTADAAPVVINAVERAEMDAGRR